eukprot:GHVR01184434.1.p1 GENE.GHVR01184434.1~~GHVR01184434.1.p1  ORF type:complete len:136 (-),score=28.48 GHVR01184434.1:1004-1411(-)
MSKLPVMELSRVQSRAELANFADKAGARTGPMHLHSAELFGSASPLQMERTKYRPKVPSCFKNTAVECFDEVLHEIEQMDAEGLKAALPNLFNGHYCEVRAAVNPIAFRRRPLRIGIVLSGGPAPGVVQPLVVIT